MTETVEGSSSMHYEQPEFISDATSFLAHLFGIGRGADLIIYASLLIAFYLILRIHLTLARLEQEITQIVRAIALERLTEPLDSGSGRK
jgi:hypothetical protein